MKHLIYTTEVYRVDDMDAVDSLREDVEADGRYAVSSFTYKAKCKKEKGEIVDEWYQVSVKKIFNDEKDPMSAVDVHYEVG
jgi:hypothetical protein